MDKPGADALAWDPTGTIEPWIRAYEIAGIAPNSFDVMYYSIDPDFYDNYYKPITTGGIFGPNFPLRLDLGARAGSSYANFSIDNQIGMAAETLQPGLVGEQPDLVKKAPGVAAQLLTDWAPAGVMDYSHFPSSFATCEKPVTETLKSRGVPVPGSCLVGGRTGYSVKIVSKAFLNSSDLELGGEGIVGPLQNAPGNNF
jgi:hypothetical protein